MIILGYVGKHKGQGLRAWLGWALIRAGQIGRTWRRVTHTEVLIRGAWDNATIASSSLVDGGVRIKTTKLNPGNWKVFELPDQWGRNTMTARLWFGEHDGSPYDWRGAAGSVLYGLGHRRGGWFCNEACGASMRQTDPHKMPPAGFIAWLVDLGAVDITDQFFKSEIVNGGR